VQCLGTGRLHEWYRAAQARLRLLELAAVRKAAQDAAKAPAALKRLLIPCTIHAG